MKTITSLTFLAFTFCAVFLDPAGAQPLTITTIAGQYTNVNFLNRVGTNALFMNPGPMAADQAGNLYVIDGNYDAASVGSCIRKISPDHTVTTFAGDPYQSGYVDATGTNARFGQLSGIAVDKNGYIYVSDGNPVSVNNTDGNIRKISPSGVVTTPTVKLNVELTSIAVDSSGNIYVAGFDFTTEQLVVEKITPNGVVSIMSKKSPDGPGDCGLAVDGAGIVYDAFGYGIDKFSPDGTKTIWVGSRAGGTELDGIGTNAAFTTAFAIALDRSGGAYVTDDGTIRYVSPAGVVSTVAGLAGQAPTTNNDGVGSNARFSDAFLCGIAVDTAGNVYRTDPGSATVLKGVPPSLPPIGSFTESPGGTPVRSSNPWQFTAYFTNVVSDLRLHVQSTTTTNNDGSWADLPDGGQMADKDGNWTLNTTDVLTGTQYFRVVASAPGYADNASAAVGPETVLDGIAPFGFFKWETTYPNESGTLWVFNIDESSVISGLNLRVQSNQDGKGWNDLPGGQMTRFGSTWALNTTNVPTGQVSFRVVAFAPNYINRISASLGPFTITPPLPTVTESSSTGGTFTLDSIMGPTPQQIYFKAVQAAVVKFGCVDTVQYNSAVNLAGEQYAAVVLQIEKDQNVPILAVNMGQNSTLILVGAITGNAALIGDNGSQLIGTSGSILTHDAGTIAAVVSTDGAGLISQDGSGLISQDGSGLISQDGSGLISQDGSGLTGHALAAVSVASKTPLTPSPKIPAPTQPTFTGQMTINGNYSQFPGTALIIGIAGTNTLSDGAQQFDQLVVNGQVNFLGGTIDFVLLDPDDQTNLANAFQPPDGATFDVVVASNIVVGTVHILGPVWGDGLFFKGGVVTRDDGLQAVRLTATHIPPQLFIQNDGSGLNLIYGTNYTGYTVESSTNLTDWTPYSTGANVVPLDPTASASQFFRMSKP